MCADIFRIGADVSGQPLATLQIKTAKSADKVSIFSKTNPFAEESILLGWNFTGQSGHQCADRSHNDCQNINIATNICREITLLVMCSYRRHPSEGHFRVEMEGENRCIQMIIQEEEFVVVL